MRSLRLIAFLALLLVPSVVVAAVVMVGEDEASTPPATKATTADPSHVAPVDARTVLVSRADAPPSRPGSAVRVRLLRGVLPTTPIDAVVLSDEDCAPDASGISHCRNALRLADGRTTVVRHHHDMRLVPCLARGEHVLVRSV